MAVLVIFHVQKQQQQGFEGDGKETDRNPEIRSGLYEVDPNFLSYRVRSVDQAPRAFLFAYFDHVLPREEGTGVGYDAVDDDDAPSVGSGGVLQQVILNCWRVDACEVGNARLMMLAVGCGRTSLMCCTVHEIALYVVETVSDQKNDDLVVVHCDVVYFQCHIRDLYEMVMSPSSHSKFRKTVLIPTDAFSTNTISSVLAPMGDATLARVSTSMGRYEILWNRSGHASIFAVSSSTASCTGLGVVPNEPRELKKGKLSVLILVFDVVVAYV